MSNKVEVTGNRQSPIDIQTSDVISKRTKRSGDDEQELEVDFSALTGQKVELTNTGHGWQLTVPQSLGPKCYVTGGPLGKDRYELLQVHAHWGRDANSGSEHLINGEAYPAEFHLVAWNHCKYHSAKEAQECSNDGMCVIGVFAQLCDQANPSLDPIVNGLSTIKKKDQKTSITCPDLNQLVPERCSPQYYHYKGSLTTPPFSESVLWLLQKSPICINEKQIAAMRELHEKEDGGEKVMENFRKCQDLKNRPIVKYD